MPFGAVCRDDAPACAEGVRRRSNLALNKNAVADSQEADSVKAKNATDGDTTSKSSRWGSAVDASHGEHWIYVDLGKDEKVSSAKVYWEARKATGFKIQVAKAEDAKDNDSTKWTWKDVYTTTERPKDKTSVINFDTTSARYVRLLITGFTGNDPYGDAVDWDAVSIYELEVYADKQTETPDEPTTEQPTSHSRRPPRPARTTTTRTVPVQSMARRRARATIAG